MHGKTPGIRDFSSDAIGLVRQVASAVCACLPLLNTLWPIFLGKKNKLASP